MSLTRPMSLALVAALAAYPAFAQTGTTGTGATGAGTNTTTTTHPATTTAQGSATSTPTVGRATPDTGATTSTAPALGTTAPAARNGAPMAPATADTRNAPSDRNPVLADNGDVRASKLIGSSVYNDKDEKIGSVDDVLIGKDNKPSQAVLSIGGFLGMGAKLVAVPYDQLKFGDTNAKSDQRVMLPGASKDALNNMQPFHYVAANANTNG